VSVCLCVCVSVSYRTHLNVVGMGPTLLGVVRKTLWWSSTGQMFKKLILKKSVFFYGKWKNGRDREKTPGTGAGTRNGAGKGTGAGTRNVYRPEQRGVPPTSKLIVPVSWQINSCRGSIL
jgi:hypothetical protein